MGGGLLSTPSRAGGLPQQEEKSGQNLSKEGGRRRIRGVSTQAPQGKTESKRGTRARCMSPQDDAPAIACADDLASNWGPLHGSDDGSRHRDDVRDSDSRQSSFKLPGSNATTVFVSALMNSMPRWLLKSNGKLRSFFAFHP